MIHQLSGVESGCSFAPTLIGGERDGPASRARSFASPSERPPGQLGVSLVRPNTHGGS